VTVGSGVCVPVGTDVKVDVFVGVEVELAVGVGGERRAYVTTSWAGNTPSRDENSAPSVPSATKANVYNPFPLTRGVTSYSTQVFGARAPFLSTVPLNSDGLLSHVTLASVQALSASAIAGPLLVPLVVT